MSSLRPSRFAIGERIADFFAPPDENVVWMLFRRMLLNGPLQNNLLAPAILLAISCGFSLRLAVGFLLALAAYMDFMLLPVTTLKFRRSPLFPELMAAPLADEDIFKAIASVTRLSLSVACCLYGLGFLSVSARFAIQIKSMSILLAMIPVAAIHGFPFLVIRANSWIALRYRIPCATTGLVVGLTILQLVLHTGAAALLTSVICVAVFIFGDFCMLSAEDNHVAWFRQKISENG